MGKHLESQLKKIVQRSIGFELIQILFFAEHPDFKPDKFCRKAVFEQMEMIDPGFLEEKNE